MTVPSDLVVKVVIRLFGSNGTERVLHSLKKCSAEVPVAERDRVQLAVLKLCDEDSTRNLDRWAVAAQTDYRDVLLWAECPGEASADARARLSSKELRAYRAADRGQYAAWLKSVA